jgi:hypothetical protein
VGVAGAGEEEAAGEGLRWSDLTGALLADLCGGGRSAVESKKKRKKKRVRHLL